MATRKQTPLGLSEQELREALIEELTVAFRTEHGETIHAIAHSVARVIELDHLRLAEQLERAGISLGEAERETGGKQQP
jgi:hypothetical protein